MAKGITRKEWQRLLDRDGGRCLHCGETEALSPHHRRNRGMGGSSNVETNSSANLMVLCSRANLLIEANGDWAQSARVNGWKLRPGESVSRPVYDANVLAWFILDADYGRTLC